MDTTLLIGIAIAFAAALGITPLVRAMARRTGMVTRPRGDRWAKKPTALLGGVAIFAAFALAAVTFLPDIAHGEIVLGASALMFAVGLIDDIRPLKPYQKLVGQIAAATVLILAGLTLPWTPWEVVNMAITLVWLVGITNAINLLDNMDGLAGGVGAIAAIVLAATFFLNGDATEAVWMAAFAAALIGFLVYNSNPASIFMGDGGSLFVGFFLASGALLNVSGGRVSGLLPVLAVPALLLVIPIFDTTLVTVLRKFAGRSVSQGGRDHSSHRLVAMGLSERKAVGLLYALAAVSGLIAILVRHVPADVGLMVIGILILGLTLLGIHMSGVKVYPDGGPRPLASRPVVGFLVDLSYKRRVFEVVLDVALIGLAYYAAHLLVFGPLEPAGALPLFLRTLPVLVVLKLIAFLGAGVYRGLWRYVSVHDMVVHVQAVVIGSVLSILAFLFLERFAGLSRVVFVLDALLLLLLLSGSRVGFVLIRRLLPHKTAESRRRVLIYGAGDGGEMLLREVRNNTDLGCEPIGFADDDPRKKGMVIHGLRVFGGNGSFKNIIREHKVDAVYVSSPKFTPERLDEIGQECGSVGIELYKVRMVIEPICIMSDPLRLSARETSLATPRVFAS
jgi:UDP-GlcNAc:undecaprenyl-phosphate/decaprenyl-phosphate GlcNAc-1-phosphate transferase